MTHERIHPVPILDNTIDDSDVAERIVAGKTHVSRPPTNRRYNTRREDEPPPTELFYPEQFLVLGTTIERLNRLTPNVARSAGVTMTPDKIKFMLAAGRKLLTETPGLETKMATAQGPLYQSMRYFRRHKRKFEGSYANPDLTLSEQIMKIMLGMNDMQLIQLQTEADAKDLPLKRRPVV